MRAQVVRERVDPIGRAPGPAAAVVFAAAIALVLAAWPTGAENRIFLYCVSTPGTCVTTDDMSSESIGSALAGVADPSGTFPDHALVLSYYEVGSSDSTPSLPGEFTYPGIVVVRPTAASSPRFWRALAEGDVWDSCTLYFTRSASSSSTGETYATVELSTVVIRQIESRAVAQLDLPGTGRGHVESIVFLPQQITWTTGNQAIGTVTYTYDFGPPSAAAR